MIGNPYATPLPGSPGYPTKPTASGMPTPYQDTPPKHWDGIGIGGDKFPLPGGMPGGMPDSPLPGAQDQPQPYGGMVDLGGMLQRRKADDERRQMLAQMLAGQQQRPQGPAPYANSSHPMDLPPPIAEASPWSIVTAAFQGLADGYKRSKSQGGTTDEGANAFWGSNGGMKS